MPRLKLNRQTIRALTDLSGLAGGEPKESHGGEPSCVTVSGCNTYRDITCASHLQSCLTQPNYCV